MTDKLVRRPVDQSGFFRPADRAGFRKKSAGSTPKTSASFPMISRPNVCHGPLDPAQVGPVHPRILSQRLLGQLPLVADAAEGREQLAKVHVLPSDLWFNSLRLLSRIITGPPRGRWENAIHFRIAKPVESEKGKAGIVVGSKEKLPAVIDALSAAVRARELDELFSQAAKAGTIRKRKAA